MGHVRRAETLQQRVVFLGLGVAGIAHLAAAYEHRESPLLVGLFATIAVVQIASGVGFLRAPDRRRSFVSMITVALLAAWAASRTVGLAIGHSHGPEAAAALDVTAAIAQVIVLLALVRGRSRRAASSRRGIAAFAVALAVAGFASQSHAPSGHHGPPYSASTEPAPAGRDATPALRTPGSPMVLEVEVEAEPAAPTTHEHCSGAGCQPHDHP